MASAQHDFTTTGPGTLAGRYLRLFWQPVFLLERIRPGQAKPIRIMSEDYTLYRGATGDPYLIAFRCAHRGAQLSIGMVEGEEIRCRFHGWKFAGDGRCVDQPAELEQQFCGKVRVRHWPIRVYQGLVFAYLGEGDPPPFPTYPEVEGDGDIEPICYRRNCNFFNSIDNLFDESHVTYTHPIGFARVPEMPRITYKRGEADAALYSERPGRGVRVRHFLMPNVLKLKVPTDDPEVFWMDYVNWRVPIDDGAHDTFAIQYVNVTGDMRERYAARRQRLRSLPVPPTDDLAVATLRGDTTLEEAEASMGEVDPNFKIFLEDHVTQIGQGIVADRSAEWLGSADVGVRLLRELWLEQLDRLAGGQLPNYAAPLLDVRIASGDRSDFATAP